MSFLDPLLTLAGSWYATYQLRGDPSFASDSSSSAVVVPMLRGRFVRIDYTWSDRGTAQEGAILIGFEPTASLVSVVWVDSWHNGARMLISTGTAGPDGVVDVRGTYPTGPDSPDWGWRTRLEPSTDAWSMTMFNVSPDGAETIAVQAAYQRGEP